MTATPTLSNAAILFRAATTSLADSLASAVVQVRSQNTGSGGAGLIWGRSGLVVTNAHCVPRGAAIEVSTGSTGRWREARVIGYHPPHDLALLETRWTGRQVDGWTEIRDAESLRPGELLFAHGHPLGVRDALAMGVLHDIARDRRTGQPRWIVADVRLAPGNSGGPLVDADGRLVGINSMVVNGLGVAVPAALAQQFVDRVLAKRAA
jgi:serine protease Do